MKKYMLPLVLWSGLLSAKVLEINEDHSKILFDIDYMKLTTVQGQFKKYSGTFNMNEAETEIKDISVVIKADSVDTNEPKRDFHLKGHEFFLTTTYPEIDFKAPGPITIPHDKKFKVKGTLTLRGIKKAMTFDALYKGKILDPWKKENYFFDLSGELDRQDFGMKWNKELDNGGYLVGDKVRIKISIQAQIAGEKTPFSTHMVPSTKGIVERDQLKRGKIKKLSTSTDPNDYPKKSNESEKKD
ncbi:MAG: YceI family protein [Bacteriovorax sp.]